MEMWELIQECQIASLPGYYNKNQFIEELASVNPEQFSRFCRQYLHLMEFHSINQGVWVTDHIPFVNKHPNMFWKLRPIDFDKPVNFIRIR